MPIIYTTNSNTINLHWFPHFPSPSNQKSKPLPGSTLDSDLDRSRFLPEWFFMNETTNNECGANNAHSFSQWAAAIVKKSLHRFRISISKCAEMEITF